MIVAAAVCPPAPLLVPGLADRLAATTPELAAACLAAVKSLGDADGLLMISAGRPGGGGAVYPPGTTVSAAGLFRSDRAVLEAVTLPGDAHGLPAGEPGDGPADVSVGTAVGASLISVAGIATPVTAQEVDPSNPARLAAPDGRISVLVLADGAACHGEHAPGAPDPRSGPFDADLVAALRSGRPEVLADACDRLAELAPALRADALPALAAFADLAARQARGPAVAEVLHYSAPFGVGYPVAVWQWP
ncbi:MAG TPA: hypothetical protein VFM01_07015 [Nakamurella sp.]|nr:hypothetical protein [Nakamurella sp.]